MRKRKTRLSRALTLKTHQGISKILAIKVKKTNLRGKREKEEANIAWDTILDNQFS